MAEPVLSWPQSVAGFDALIEATQHRLIRFAFCRLHSQADAEDCRPGRAGASISRSRAAPERGQRSPVPVPYGRQPRHGRAAETQAFGAAQPSRRSAGRARTLDPRPARPAAGGASRCDSPAQRQPSAPLDRRRRLLELSARPPPQWVHSPFICHPHNRFHANSYDRGRIRRALLRGNG